MLRRPTLSLSLRTYAKPLLLLLLLLHICTVPVYMCGNALRCALNQPLHREKAQIYTRRRHVDYYMTFAYCTCRLIPSSLLLLHLLLLPSDSCIDYAVPFADGRRLLHHPIPCVVPRIRDFKLCCCCYLRCLSVWECLLRRNERELSWIHLLAYYKLRRENVDVDERRKRIIEKKQDGSFFLLVRFPICLHHHHWINNKKKKKYVIRFLTIFLFTFSDRKIKNWILSVNQRCILKLSFAKLLLEYSRRGAELFFFC